MTGPGIEADGPSESRDPPVEPDDERSNSRLRSLFPVLAGATALSILIGCLIDLRVW